ncbi:DUF2637 domain-containing protein [Streptomyces sp. NPDC051554]|uniref:DUF2637 domain-containing protein n=1 Tax=Streptomyces sp. NPDC051554 TaxID=3365656 RepID=UPI0037A49AA6
MVGSRSADIEPQEGVAGSRGFGLDVWIRPLCALVVAGVAAYASYVHQREFALQGGADTVSASLWPLSVDGLLLPVGLPKPRRPTCAGREARCGRLSCWGSRSRWRRISRRHPLSSGSRSLSPDGLPSRCCCRWNSLVHRPVDRLDVTPGQLGEGDSHATSERLQEDADPLLPRARMVDARHWELHQRPVSAETLRKELRIGARRSR